MSMIPVRTLLSRQDPTAPKMQVHPHALPQRLMCLDFVSQNHDLNFAFSTDLGETWQNNWNQTIANMPDEQPIIPVSAGIVMFGIPKYGWVVLAPISSSLC